MVMSSGQGGHSTASNYMPMEKPRSYMEKFQAMQQVMTNSGGASQRSQLIENSTTIAGTSY